MKDNLSSDSLAILLLCTNLAIPYKAENAPKALTPSEWEDISQRLRNQELWPRDFFQKSSSDWKSLLGLTDTQVERLERLLSRSGQLGLELERLSNLGIWITTRAESTYPLRWKRALMKQCPIVMYGAGNSDLLNIKDQHGVAIVGSRDVDEEGARFAEQLGQRCAEEGYYVVSGGAKGVDLLAQNAANRSGGKVISILSEGLEGNVRKKDIRQAILSGRTLILSAVTPKGRFQGYHAMARNKYVYTLSDYAVVVSSALKGGTWTGAVENLRAKWVPLFVRKTSNIPQGNLRLIEQGGIPILPEMISNLEVSFKNSFFPGVEGTEKTDLFEIVWPIIEERLKMPCKQKELADQLQVIELQMEQWLKRAQQFGMVEKTSGNMFISTKRQTTRRTVEYPQEYIEQSSIFDYHD